MEIIVIAHNLRSTYNVGSIIRTMDGLGLQQLYLTGTSPYPLVENDHRLAHIAQKNHRQIHKTSLGAENFIKSTHHQDIQLLINDLKQSNFQVIALEQTQYSVDLTKLQFDLKIALIVGNEISGLENDVLKQADKICHIPMHGKKESFNVAIATAMALFYFKNFTSI